MKLVVALASVALLASCSSGAPGTAGESPPPASVAPGAEMDLATGGPASQTSGPVIATIMTRDKRVAIVGGGKELRVVVRNADGALVADGLTLAELRSRDAFLSVVVESAVAGSGSSFIDARYHKEPPKTPLLSDL